MAHTPSFVAELRAVLAREWALERRQRYALNGLLLYVVSTVVVASLGLRAGRAPDDAAVWAVTFWLLMTYAALTAVAKGFVAEREGQLLQLYGWVSPQALIVARLLYHVLLLVGLGAVAYAAYSLLMGAPGPFWGLLPIIALGAAALGAGLTLSAALAGRARQSATLMAVLSLPLVVPQLLTLIRMTQRWALGADSPVGDWVSLGTLALLPALVSLLLYPFLWREA